MSRPAATRATSAARQEYRFRGAVGVHVPCRLAARSGRPARRDVRDRGAGRAPRRSLGGADRDQLGLDEDAVSFLAYHGDNDGDHLDMFDRALELAITSDAVADDVVRHARIVARLYRLQLEEIDHV